MDTEEKVEQEARQRERESKTRVTIAQTFNRWSERQLHCDIHVAFLLVV